MAVVMQRFFLVFLVALLAACGSSTPSSTGSSANTNLTGLMLSGDLQLDQDFQRGVTDFSATVPFDISTLSVTPLLEDNGAHVTVNDMTVRSGQPSTDLSLDVGENTINIAVTAADGSTRKVYTLTVTRLSNDNTNLANVTVSAGSLSQAFLPSVLNYTVNVANSVSTISVTASTQDPVATMMVNNVSVTSGQPSVAMPLVIGSNVITIEVTAQDGSSTKNYTLVVNRQDEGVTGNSARLSNLSISQGSLSPAFLSATTSYATTVANTVSDITVTPTVEVAGATVTVNSLDVNSGSSSDPISLAVGANVISVVVTAEDGVTTKEYQVTVNRLARSDASLSTLAVSSGELSPAFNSGIFVYSVSVDNTTTKFDLTPGTTDSAAAITVNGVSVDSGFPSQAILLAEGNNSITVRVTAQDNTSQQVYTVNVFRQGTADVNLSDLSLLSGTLSPTFDPNIVSYSVTIANATTSLAVTPTASDATSTITVNNSTVASGAVSGSINLDVGLNDIYILVESQDATTQKLYKITVTRDGTENADLQNLVVSDGTLEPLFSPGTTGYNATVPYDTATVTVTPTSVLNTSTIKVNGVTISSGSASGNLSLSVGSNTVTIDVISQNSTLQRSYYLNITRVGKNETNLDGISLSQGLLTNFDSAVTDYQLSVNNSVSTLNVAPSLTDSNATVTVNGGAPGDVALAEGENIIEVVVTAEDGSSSRTYTLVVTRELITNANLQNLVLSDGTLTPAFDPTVTAYTASVGKTVSSITVTPTTEASAASVTVEGVTVTSGTASGAVSLGAGDNVITVEVTAEDGTTTQAYTVTVNRPANTNAALGNLLVSKTGLTPVFDSVQTAYTLDVDNATTTITFAPTVDDPNASVTVNGDPVTSGMASNAIPLNIGANVVNILVTAEDGTTQKNYAITVNRAGSSINTLDALSVSGVTLSPVFDSATSTYSASVSNGTTSVTVTPTVTDANATVKVNTVSVTSGTASGSISLNEGANAISVVVTAEDGSTNTYTINITRSTASTDATLSALTVSTGSLSPSFTSGTTAYTVNVPYATTTVTMTATVSDANYTGLTVDAVSGTSGVASAGIALSVGNNPIDVVVTAEDGTTTKTYTVTVHRNNNDATLSALTLSDGTLTPSFSSGTLTYTADVGNAVSSITMTATVSDVNYSGLTINSASESSGAASGAIALGVGPNPIDIVVTAEDNSITQTYTVTVTRASANSTTTLHPSGVASNPGSYGVTGGAWADVLDSNDGDTSYVERCCTGPTVKFWVDMDDPSGLTGATIHSITFHAYVRNTSSSDDVNIGYMTDGATTVWEGATTLASSGSYSLISSSAYTTDSAGGALDLTDLNNLQIAVDRIGTGPSGLRVTEVYADIEYTPSSDADLTDLIPSTNSLEQTFQSASTGYTMTVGYVIQEMMVTPTLSNPDATMTVNGQSVTDGTESQAISLTAGSNTDINVVVTAPDTTTTKTYTITVTREALATFAETAYVKASNTQTTDKFGYSIDISGDWMVVGAVNEDGSITSDGQTADNNSTTDGGGVYVFKRTSGTWAQQAYLKPAVALDASDGFGYAVAIDGDTIAIGMPGDDSGYTGVYHPGDADWSNAQNANGSTNIGSIIVFRDTSGTGAGTWTQEAYLKASFADASYFLGRSVAISGDTIIAGTISDDSSIAGVQNTSTPTTDNSAADSGAAWVFKRTGSTWSQEALLKPDNPSAGDWYGMSVGIDGDTAIVSSPYEDTGATNAGAVYVFVRSGATWSQQAMLKEGTPAAEDRMGGGRATCGCDYIFEEIDISGDTVAASVSLDGTAGSGAGAVAVFVRSGTSWSQQALLVANETIPNQLASGLGLDGDTLVIGAAQAASDTTGINTTPNSNAANSGAAWVFTRSGTTWTQRYYIKPSNTGAGDNFGSRCDVNQGTVACASIEEDGSATGINPVNDDAATTAGAVYIFQ